MISRKKLQVFVSSTYEDLKEERQAAVEAILSAGHIPAGMELFAAGDETQMRVIERWIDESDVFLLILGGRYGSIEPTSGKSYVQLEYEYAQKQNKPFFAVVIDGDHLEQKVLKHGSAMMEKKNPQALEIFRDQVTSKLIRFFRDPRDIKLAVYETLNDFSRRDELIGWVPGNQVNSGAVAEELARSAKENAELRKRVSELEGSGEAENQQHFQSLEPRIGEVISDEKVEQMRFFDIGEWIKALPPITTLRDLEEDAFLQRLAEPLQGMGSLLKERFRRQALFKSLARLVSSSNPEQRERFIEALQSQIHDESAKMLIIKSLAEQDGETLRNYARIGMDFDVLNEADLANELKRRFTADG
jgi:Domain of unknown function (DUF4062)